jgi:integrase
MNDMPRPIPQHLHRQITRHGQVVWYVRVGKGPRTRIRAEYGTAEFFEAYRTALANGPKPSKSGPIVGTLGWLIARYRETMSWNALSAATRRQRENIFKHVVETAGTVKISSITTGHIVQGRERRKDTPAQARNFLDAMRGLFEWAVEAQHIRRDPTIGVKNPPRRKGDGFRPWTEDDVAAYERRWPIGTRQRVWLAVLLYTGLRRGDAVRLGRQHVRNGIAKIKTEKSGGTVQVTLPILLVLQRTLDAGPCGELTFICGERGQRFTKESFGNEFREACKAASVPGSAHGVRKIAATRGRITARRSRSLRRCLGGQGARWRRSTRDQRIANDSRAQLSKSLMFLMLMNGAAPRLNMTKPSAKALKEKETVAIDGLLHLATSTCPLCLWVRMPDPYSGRTFPSRRWGSGAFKNACK